MSDEGLDSCVIHPGETIPYLPNVKKLDFEFCDVDLVVVNFLVDQCPNVTAANFGGSKGVGGGLSLYTAFF